MTFRFIKQNCEIDGFLAWLHVLVLMDDTVLLSTSRRGMISKIGILNQFCGTHGMSINMNKTKFFVIHGSASDGEPMKVGGLTVEPCEQYMYLGSPFTADGSTSSAIKVHVHQKMCQVLKFVSFVTKNNDVPFYI